MDEAAFNESYAARYAFWAEHARSAGYDERRLAMHRQITVRQLQRQFQRDLNRAPEEWLNELRMVDARQLLLEARQVKEVACQLGFKQQSNFFRKFKETYRMTPSQFAREAAQNQAKSP